MGAGAGSCWAITEGGGVTGASPSAALSVMTGVPSLTRSPTLTSTASTVPSRSAGTSMVALSHSSVISGSSALIASPGLTWISITGTSLKSPMSGTLTSIAIGGSSPARPRTAGIDSFRDLRVASDLGRVRLVRIDAVLLDRLADLGRPARRRPAPGSPAPPGSPSGGRPRRSGAASGGSRSGRSRPCPARGSAAGTIGPDLVGEHPHVVGRRHHRPLAGRRGTARPSSCAASRSGAAGSSARRRRRRGRAR